MKSGMSEELVLVKYRDSGMNTYTYFYTKDDKMVSPFFDSEKEAEAWLRKDEWDYWKPNRDL